MAEPKQVLSTISGQIKSFYKTSAYIYIKTSLYVKPPSTFKFSILTIFSTISITSLVLYDMAS